MAVKMTEITDDEVDPKLVPMVDQIDNILRGNDIALVMSALATMIGRVAHGVPIDIQNQVLLDLLTVIDQLVDEVNQDNVDNLVQSIVLLKEKLH